MVAQNFTRIFLVALVAALFVPAQASATCLTSSEAKRLLSETSKQVTAPKAKKKKRGKKSKASLKQLVKQVVVRSQGSRSRAEQQAWDRLFLALKPHVSGTSTCRVESRNQAGLTAVLARLLANPKPPVFDIVAVQYLAQKLASGADDSWS